MALSDNKKEMLFIIGRFFRETNKRFSETPLDVSVMKAEFIDAVISLGLVSKKERAIYKNLEELEADKYTVYDDRNLQLTKKGFDAYEKVRNEIERYCWLSSEMKADKILFKRRMQTKLKI